MKLFSITNEQKIQDSINHLYKKLSENPHEELVIPCGGPEGKQTIAVCYSGFYDFWWGSKVEKNKNKYWNPVGFGFPNPKVLNRGDCEFNCAIKGHGGHAGIFAKDFNNNIYLLHNGKAGGSTPGTTIEGFSKVYGREKQAVEIEGQPYDFFMVTDINSNILLENIVGYAKAIFDFKKQLNKTG